MTTWQPSFQGDSAVGLRELEGGTTPDEALSFFDSLPPATVKGMIGAWRGSGFETGHPWDGFLGEIGWHGKRFRSAEGVDPLVFDGKRGRFLLNPGLLPMGLIVRFSSLLHKPVVQRFLRAVLPLLSTSKPQARLRLMEYRGVVSATMCYDGQPINDHFRFVDEDTLVGAMDLRGFNAPLLFVLRREHVPA